MTSDIGPQQVDTPVTTIIRQRPMPDAVSRYEAWLNEIIPVAQSFAGHQGINVIRPNTASEDYTIVLHFDSMANLRNWLDSERRIQLVEKIHPFLYTPESIDIKTGLEFWFTPLASGKAAPPYKQFLITLSAIFPLTLIIPWLLQPIFAWVPVLGLPGVGQFIVAAIITALMVYVIMPRYTRLVSRWLFH